MLPWFFLFRPSVGKVEGIMSSPLTTLKILDFSTLLPGPFATLLLGDMGAEVLRVESASRTDLIRELPPMISGVSAAHAYLNRNKRSIALDLKRQAAQELIAQLVAEYDVLIEQFRPGVMDALNLGYEVLARINPRLIYVSITGYGQSGPYRDRAGHDLNYLALSGLSSYSGRKAHGPVLLGTQIADLGGSLHAVAGLLAAVIQRQHSGRGQRVDVSLADCVFSLNAVIGASFLVDGKTPDCETNILNGGGFYDYYQTRDGRWLSVAGVEPKFRQALCKALNREDLLLLGMSAGEEDQRAFKTALKDIFVARTFDEWCAWLVEVDVCVEPVLDLAEAVEHPHFQARGMVLDIPDETCRQIACPLKFSEAQTPLKHVGKVVGADSAQVLRELGYAEERIAALFESGTVS